MVYEDRSIGVTDDTLTIKGYYFPGSTKRVALSSVQRVERVPTGATRGRGRIWGTANPGYWANWDPKRTGKTFAFLVDVGKAVKPFVTPDDPDAFEAALREHDITVVSGDRGPIV